MKIAVLVLAHVDPDHIARLSKRVGAWADVFIHVDAKVDEKPFREKAAGLPNVYFSEKRYACYWAGFSIVRATIELIRNATSRGRYDRVIFLMGLDYPIKTDLYILDFFEKHKTVEFIRGCRITGAKDAYFYRRARCLWFYDRINFIKRCINKVNTLVPILFRKDFTRTDGGERFEFFWGHAQWLLTGECAEYVLNFYDNNEKLNHYFQRTFSPDETYFTSIVLNSGYSRKTLHAGPEPLQKYVRNWRNLHYFNYTGSTQFFTEADYETLVNDQALFCRKVNTKLSSKLLDMLDEDNRAVSPMS